MKTRRSTGKTAKTRHITTTSKGFRIRTYEAPPPEFNPLTATPRLLLHHGFPTRPDAKTQPELRKIWDKALSRPRTWITPVFREVKGKSHGPALRPGGARTKISASKGIANATSSNWSGSVALAPVRRTFGWVAGQWTVPNPHAPVSCLYRCAASLLRSASARPGWRYSLQASRTTRPYLPSWRSPSLPSPWQLAPRSGQALVLSSAGQHHRALP